MRNNVYYQSDGITLNVVARKYDYVIWLNSIMIIQNVKWLLKLFNARLPDMYNGYSSDAQDTCCHVFIMFWSYVSITIELKTQSTLMVLKIYFLV